ncbi:morphogenetic protein [Serratia sp. IR-2025]
MNLRSLKFNDEMLQAVTVGSKTQTRRPIEGYPVFELADNGLWRVHGPSPRQQDVLDEDDNVIGVIPEGTFEKILILPKYIDRYCPYTKGETFINACDKDGNPVLTLAVRVRVERLNDISDGDAIREGCSAADMKSGDCVADVFARLWSSIYGVDSWNANPWVWVIEFRRVGGA